MSQELSSSFTEATPEAAAAPTHDVCGSAAFLSAGETIEKIAAWQRAGIFVVRVEASMSTRGHLEEVVDDAIDAALAAHGASPPGMALSLDHDAACSDRIFRARRLGFYGIAVIFSSLRAAASTRGTLDPGDCASLRLLADLTSDRPFWIVFDRADRDLGAHGRPIPFSAIFASPAAQPAPRKIPAFISTPPRATEIATPTETHSRAEAATIGVSVALPEETWRGWMLALTAARGPQSLATFEKLFVEAYLPLLHAITAGLEDPRAKASMLVFRRTFEGSYPEAAARFQMTSKRPGMVLDAPQHAMKLARTNGARMSQIILVEAMRYDLGLKVRDAFELAMGARAMLIDSCRLHAALPTTSNRQLETIARGPEALRSPVTTRDDETLGAHAGGGLRKIRVGGRELFRLDTIDVAMQSDAAAAMQRFDDLAENVAETIAQHARVLRVRTLLYILGDRGFSIDASGRAKCGGVTPEEVIVPAFAFVVDAVQ